uniref:Uncharacterized protein n=1 Tax=Wuchereria bancrofti TaxID=6293 RepID=A0A1I8EW26_WUCBA
RACRGYNFYRRCQKKYATHLGRLECRYARCSVCITEHLHPGCLFCHADKSVFFQLSKYALVLGKPVMVSGIPVGGGSIADATILTQRNQKGAKRNIRKRTASVDKWTLKLFHLLQL